MAINNETVAENLNNLSKYLEIVVEGEDHVDVLTKCEKCNKPNIAHEGNLVNDECKDEETVTDDVSEDMDEAIKSMDGYETEMEKIKTLFIKVLCKQCGYKAKTPAGLITHKRKHKAGEATENEETATEAKLMKPLMEM